jgi:hypothetical protein
LLKGKRLKSDVSSFVSALASVLQTKEKPASVPAGSDRPEKGSSVFGPSVIVSGTRPGGDRGTHPSSAVECRRRGKDAG